MGTQRSQARPEWNRPPGGSPQSLDDLLVKIRLKLKGFKGGPALILIAVVVVAYPRVQEIQGKADADDLIRFNDNGVIKGKNITT